MRRIYADLSESGVPAEVVEYFAAVGVPATFYANFIGGFFEFSFDMLALMPSERFQHSARFSTFLQKHELVELGQYQMTGGADCSICTSRASGGVWLANSEEDPPTIMLVNSSFDDFERTLNGLVSLPIVDANWSLKEAMKIVEEFGPSELWGPMVKCLREGWTEEVLAKSATWLFGFDYRNDMTPEFIVDELPIFERYQRANNYRDRSP